MTPPDTGLLAWGTVMGIEEAVARANASRLLEQALDDGVLVPGARGYATARTHRIEHWLTTQHLAHDNRAPLDAVHAERRRTWTGAPPAARRRLRGQLAPLLVSAPGVPAGTAEPLRWLLESARDGVTLTQAGYLPRALVTEAAERYDWYLPGRLPRTEHDVTRLATLHKLARHTRLLARRHRTLSLTARGRQHLTDPALLQATAATAWYSDHDFTTTIAEAATEALLHGERTLDDLTDSAHTLAAEAFTRTDGSTPAPDDTRHFLWQWLRPGEALGFLTHTDRRHSTITLTATGRAAALTELRRRAHAPPPHPGDNHVRSALGDGQHAAEFQQRGTEGQQIAGGHREMPFPDHGAQRPQSAVLRDQHGLRLIRAEQKAEGTRIPHLPGAGRGVSQQRCDGGQELLGFQPAAPGEEAAQLLQGAPGVDGLQQGGHGQGPDVVSSAGGEGIEQQGVGGGQVGHEVEVRQHPDRTPHPSRTGGSRTRQVAVGTPGRVGPQRIEADGEQPVVAAEPVKFLTAPVVAVVVPGPVRGGAADVDETEGGRVLEQHTQGVTALQQRPVVVTVVAEAAVLRIFQIQLPQGPPERTTTGS
ncbi:hypothetical protein ACWCZ5_30585 [Streptomyces sp. NPDC001667]